MLQNNQSKSNQIKSRMKIKIVYFLLLFNLTKAKFMEIIAGNGGKSFSGENVLATTAALGDPKGIYTDTQGFCFISDSSAFRVRMVSPDDAITTFSGQAQYSKSGTSSSV
jgi:hypothetical protein